MMTIWMNPVFKNKLGSENQVYARTYLHLHISLIFFDQTGNKKLIQI